MQRRQPIAHLNPFFRSPGRAHRRPALLLAGPLVTRAVSNAAIGPGADSLKLKLAERHRILAVNLGTI